jgi:hypothetical protein
MANVALGGMLSGLMQGYDYQNALNRQDALYKQAQADKAYERQRQQKADARTDTQFDEQQQDRAHSLERRPVLESREDADYGLQSAVKQLQLQKGTHDVARMPVEDQQHDAEFSLSQQAKRQQLSLGQMRLHLERMGLDDKMLEASRTKTQRALGMGLAQAQATGDWSGFVKGFNATVGQMPNAQPLESIQRANDGSLTMRMADGSARQFTDSRQLAATAAALVQPDVYLKSIFNSQFGHDGNGETVPASVKETDAIFRRLKPQDGESENDRWMRAYSMSSAKAGESPADSAAGFYRTMVKDAGLKPDKAMDATRSFMSQFYPSAKGPWNGGQQDAPAPVFTDPGSGVAPPPRFAQPAPRAPAPQAQPQQAPQARPRVVRYGTSRDGTRVAQLEDGTVVPVQQ